jgi:hypothetical protein
MNTLLFSLGSVLFVSLLLFVFEKFFSGIKAKLSDEVVGIYFNFIGVLFTLILAFVVVAAWEDYDNAMHAVENEAHKLAYIYEDAEELSPANKKQIQDNVMIYTNSVIKDEWDHMDENHIVKITQNKFQKLMNLKRTLSPQGDEEVLKGIDDSLDELKILRHERQSHSESHVPNLLWMMLLGGFILCILMSFLLNFENLVWKMVMTSTVTFAMSIVLYLTFCLSNPYKGDMKVSSEDYLKVLELPAELNK